MATAAMVADHPAERSVLVLDNLHHSVSTESLVNFLENQNFEQGITWESAVVVKKKLLHNLSFEINSEEEDEGHVFEGNEGNVEEGDPETYDENVDQQNEEEGSNHDREDGHELDTTIIGKEGQISPSGSVCSGDLTTEEGSPYEEDAHTGEELQDNLAALQLPLITVSDEDQELYHRGFIICSGLHTAQYMLYGLEGLNLFGKQLEARMADEYDLKELREHERSQTVPKLLISSINERTPQIAMRVGMVKELLRVIKWSMQVDIQRVPRTSENLSAGTQFLLTPQTSEETQQLLQLLKEVNFYEFKITANVQPALVELEQCENQKDKGSRHFPSWSDSGIEESGPISNRSRSNSEGDPSMSCLNSTSSSSLSAYSCTSAHIVPKSATAWLTPQSVLTHLPLRFLIPEMYARSLIGENQQTIRWIAEKSGASIAVLDKQFFMKSNNWFDKMVVLFGTNDSHHIAMKHILEIITQEAGRLILDHKPDKSSIKQLTNHLVEDDGQTIIMRIVTFNSVAGRLIGKFGKNLKDVMDTTSTTITVSATPYRWNEMRTDADRIVIIVGQFDNVLKACDIVARRLNHAFTLQYTATGNVPGEAVPLPNFTSVPSIPLAQFQHQLQNGLVPGAYLMQMPPSAASQSSLPMQFPIQLSRPQSSQNTVSTFATSGHNPPVMMNFFPQTSPLAPVSMYQAMNGSLPPNIMDQYMKNQNTVQQKPSSTAAWDRNKFARSFVYCPLRAVSAVIGQKGCNIRNIRQMTNVVVEVNNSDAFKPIVRRNRSSPERERSDDFEKQLVLSGNFSNHIRAQMLIFNLVQKYFDDLRTQVPADQEDEIEAFSHSPEDNDIKLTVEFAVPTKYVPRIIGAKGNKLQKLQNMTSTYIQFGTTGYSRGKALSDTAPESKVKIYGAFSGVKSAQGKIMGIIESIASGEEQETQASQSQFQAQMQSNPFQQMMSMQMPSLAPVTIPTAYHRAHSYEDLARIQTLQQQQQLDFSNHNSTSVHASTPGPYSQFPQMPMMQLQMNHRPCFLPTPSTPMVMPPVSMYGAGQ